MPVAFSYSFAATTLASIEFGVSSSSASSSATHSETASRAPRLSAARWPPFFCGLQYLIRGSRVIRSRTTASVLSVEQSSTTMISFTGKDCVWQLSTARATHQAIL